MRDIAIYGAGGFGKEVLTLVKHLIHAGEPWRFIGFFDDEDHLTELGSYYLGDSGALNTWKTPLHVVIAMGWSQVRREAHTRIKNPQITFPSLVSPYCCLGDKEKIHIGKGSIIMAGATLTTDIKLNEFVVININATVGHDVDLGDFCSLMPSANISGNVKIESEVFVGSGATILQGVKIGAQTIIGAGSVVTNQLPSFVTAVGVPARIIKGNK